MNDLYFVTLTVNTTKKISSSTYLILTADSKLFSQILQKYVVT